MDNALGEMPSTEGLLGPSHQDPAQRAATVSLLALGSERRALRSRRGSASWGAWRAPGWLPGGPALGVGSPVCRASRPSTLLGALAPLRHQGSPQWDLAPGSACFSSSPHPHTSAQAQARVPPRGPVRWICLVGTLWFISSCLGAPAILLGTHLATRGSWHPGQPPASSGHVPHPPEVVQLSH